MKTSFYESNFWTGSTIELAVLCAEELWVINKSRYCIVDLDADIDSDKIVEGYKTLSEAVSDMLMKLQSKPCGHRIYHLSLWKISKYCDVRKVCFAEDIATHEEIVAKLPKRVSDAIFRGFINLMEDRLECKRNKLRSEKWERRQAIK